MAFENEWEEDQPPGTQAASLGDDRIRDLKLNLGERLDDMLYGFDPENVSAPNDTYGVKKLNFKEQASIATPAANQITLAAKESADSKAELHVKDEDGDEFQITTGGSLGGCNLALTAGKDLIGSSTSDITLNTNKFTVAGATGNTSVGGTFESVGVATLADTSVLKTSGAPVADAQIANKKYVDDEVAAATPDDDAFGAWASKSDNTVYLAASDGIVIASGIGSPDELCGYTDSSNPPTTLRAVDHAFNNTDASITMPVKKGDYWKVVGADRAIYWLPIGA